MVGDLDDRVGASNAHVDNRHDAAILGDDVVVAEPCEIEHVGNTWQYLVTEERSPGVSTAPGKIVGCRHCKVGMQILREAREVALDSRLVKLVHHRLVSLVLGMDSHVHLRYDATLCFGLESTPMLISHSWTAAPMT